MAFERFTREARAVVAEAERQAAAEGADAIEPVHVLMGLGGRVGAGIPQVLRTAGTSVGGVERALGG